MTNDYLPVVASSADRVIRGWGVGVLRAEGWTFQLSFYIQVFSYTTRLSRIDSSELFEMSRRQVTDFLDSQSFYFF